jgi:hypothetical protein
MFYVLEGYSAYAVAWLRGRGIRHKEPKIVGSDPRHVCWMCSKVCMAIPLLDN